MGRLMRVLAAIALCACTATAVHAKTRAAYFYHYMEPGHLDRLAGVRFDTAIIHWIGDSLGTRGQRELAAFMDRGRTVGVTVVPQWSLQQPGRFVVSPDSRRYTWGNGRIERSIPCPLDTAYWRSALIDRADEMLAAAPRARRLAVDLEFWVGGRHHWDAGACRCPHCVEEYRAGVRVSSDARRLSGLMGWQEAELERRLVPLLQGFALRHPGVELGVFDLDYVSFAHRAFGRALARTRVPTASWCEKSYSEGASPLGSARRRLDALGLQGAPLYGGLWLQRFRPDALTSNARAIRAASDGWWVFTTYSLWNDPSKLTGPYTLPRPADDYWKALQEANAP